MFKLHIPSSNCENEPSRKIIYQDKKSPVNMKRTQKMLSGRFVHRCRTMFGYQALRFEHYILLMKPSNSIRVYLSAPANLPGCLVLATQKCPLSTQPLLLATQQHSKRLRQLLARECFQAFIAAAVVACTVSLPVQPSDDCTIQRLALLVDLETFSTLFI